MPGQHSELVKRIKQAHGKVLDAVAAGLHGDTSADWWEQEHANELNELEEQFEALRTAVIRLVNEEFESNAWYDIYEPLVDQYRDSNPAKRVSA